MNKDFIYGVDKTGRTVRISRSSPLIGATMFRFPSLLLLAFVLVAGCVSDSPESGDDAGTPVATATAVDAPGAPGSDSTRLAFDRLAAFAAEHNLAARPIGEVVQAIGVELIGVPYVEGALDKPEVESLVVDLGGFDCVTYVENVLAIAGAIQAGEPTYARYTQNLKNLRYRGGGLDGYCSRLHYFSDWMRDNARRGNVELVSRDFGQPFDKTINFMSEHRDAYPKFATDDSLFACIATMEAGLMDHEMYYVPQSEIESIYDQLQAGDIIATTTDIDGLDVTHTGFVFKDDARTGFLHASLTGEVKISDDLSDYINGNKVQTGIIVARPLAMRTQG